MEIFYVFRIKLPYLYIIYQHGNFLNFIMRVITLGRLRDFWEEYPDSEQELKYWNAKMKKANYQNSNDVIKDTPTGDTVGDNRIVFNICRNKYRLIALLRYKLDRVYIRFVGTHKEYDKIEKIREI